MKKLLLLFLATGIAFGSQAQEKKFQVGLVFGPTFNWLKVQTTKIERNGIGTGFTIGLGGNYLFNENIGIASGVQFDLESFKINYGDPSKPNLGSVYYLYDDTDIRKYDDNGTNDPADDTYEGVAETDTLASAYQLMTRKFKGKYVTIPFFLKFQTNKIGKMIYYGKFGLRTSFLAGVRMDDEGVESNYNAVTKEFTQLGTGNVLKTDMRPDAIKKGLSQVRTGIGIYGGAEWNFTGNTYLYGEVGYNYGLTPGIYKKSSHLTDVVTDDVTSTVEHSQLDVQNNPAHVFEIKIGILF